MKYSELMERIKVTPEMRSRVFANLNAGNARRARSVRRFCECAAALAAWTDGEFAYSVSAAPAISQQEMLALIECMQETNLCKSGASPFSGKTPLFC